MKTAEARLALPAGDPARGRDLQRRARGAARRGHGGRPAPTLLAAAFEDRLHEPYRPSPLLEEIRAELPGGAVGATLSGSGPTVIVWAEDADACAAELARALPDETVLPLRVVAEGAH